MQRHGIGIEIDPQYVEIAQRRIAKDAARSPRRMLSRTRPPMPDSSHADGRGGIRDAQPLAIDLFAGSDTMEAHSMIAKIPEPLSRHIARTFYPRDTPAVA